MSTLNLDDFRFEAGDNIQGFRAKFSGAGINQEAAQRQQNSGFSQASTPIQLGFVELDVYYSNYPEVKTQEVLELSYNPKARSGRWFEFVQSLKACYAGDTSFRELTGKYMNLRLEYVMGRANRNGNWVDEEQTVWKVRAVGSSLTEVTLADDASWGGSESTKQGNQTANNSLFGNTPVNQTITPTVNNPVPAAAVAAAPAITRDDLILELANGSDVSEFQSAVFRDERARDLGLTDEVMSDPTGVGVLSPFIQDGRLTQDEGGKYRKN